MLESHNADKGHGKGLHILKFTKASPVVKIGRGHQCHMRIPDISVSRIHAFIKYAQGKFILSDNRSKFGSLVKLQKPLMVTREKVAVQVGRSVLTFSLMGSQRVEVPSGEREELEIPSKYKVGLGKYGQVGVKGLRHDHHQPPLSHVISNVEKYPQYRHRSSREQERIYMKPDET